MCPLCFSIPNQQVLGQNYSPLISQQKIFLFPIPSFADNIHPTCLHTEMLPLSFFFLNLILFYFILFIYSWLCWVFVSVRGLSPIAASGGHSSSRCAGLSPSRPLPLRSTGSRCAGSVIVAHRPSRSAARGILPDQGPNPCPPHRQADSQPLRHQGSPLPYRFL